MTMALTQRTGSMALLMWIGSDDASTDGRAKRGARASPSPALYVSLGATSGVGGHPIGEVRARRLSAGTPAPGTPQIGTGRCYEQPMELPQL